MEIFQNVEDCQAAQCRSVILCGFCLFNWDPPYAGLSAELCFVGMSTDTRCLHAASKALNAISHTSNLYWQAVSLAAEVEEGTDVQELKV